MYNFKKTSGKIQKKNSKLHKKVRKNTYKNNFIIVFASKFRGINQHATWGTTGGGVCISSVISCATYKEGPRVAGSAFDTGWITSRWRDIDGGVEDERWAVSVQEDGHEGVVTGDRSGRLDYSCNFNWDECKVADEKDRVGELVKLWA